VERPTVAIISDQSSFASAVTKRWLEERDVPSFLVMRSKSYDPRLGGSFDLAIAGGISPEELGPVIDVLELTGKPVILISEMNGHGPRGANFTVLPEAFPWPELLPTIAGHILARAAATGELGKLQELNSQLEQQASLGRYMLEVRHNLNNALTSVLGNSDLILLDEHQLSPAVRSQVETIRNMGLRMNEIMQRFSSLQKEMQLVEQQSLKKAVRAGA
jgi:signal transduction histidine kinase